MAWPTADQAWRSSDPDVFKPNSPPMVFPPQDNGASPVMDDDSTFAAAVAPRPMPRTANGPMGARLVRTWTIWGAGVGGMGKLLDIEAVDVVLCVVVVVRRVVVCVVLVADVVVVVYGMPFRDLTTSVTDEYRSFLVRPFIFSVRRYCLISATSRWSILVLYGWSCLYFH